MTCHTIHINYVGTFIQTSRKHRFALASCRVLDSPGSLVSFSRRRGGSASATARDSTGALWARTLSRAWEPAASEDLNLVFKDSAPFVTEE